MPAVVVDEEWRPWYKRRTCPVFCLPCLPVYTALWSARTPVLIIGIVLFLLGVMLLFGLLLTCIAVECGGLAGALLPLALILIIVGLLLIHCGWAAGLLDHDGRLPVKKTITTTTTTTYHAPKDEGEERLFETAYRENKPELKQGYWQFEDQEAWQTTANPYPIQTTLKPCLERLPY